MRISESVQISRRWVALAVSMLCGLMMAISSAPASASSSVLGAVHRAKGSPIVFAMINLEGAPVSVPESQQGAQAAIDYVNNYEDGINGHPIVLDECSNTTLQAPASATCANELVAKHPTLVLGAADTGGAGSFPIWQAHHLAYVGGSPYTPVESNATNAVTFTGFSGPDNVAAVAYAAKSLHAKSLAIIESSDTQGLATGAEIGATAKADGMTPTYIPLSDTASTSDFAAAAEQAVSSNAAALYIEVGGSNCAPTLLALQATGYKGHVMAVGPCATGPVIKAAGSAANGLIFANPNVAFDQVNTPTWGHEIKLTEAILAKYAPATMPVDPDSMATFGAVMNLHTTLDAIKGPLTEKSILGAFEKGSNHPNWLAHPYTCNRKQDPQKTAVCDVYQQILTVKNGKVVTLDSSWVKG